MKGFAMSSSVAKPRVFSKEGFRLLKNPSNPAMQNKSIERSRNRLPVSSLVKSEAMKMLKPRPTQRNIRPRSQTRLSIAQIPCRRAVAGCSTKMPQPYLGTGS